MHEGRPSVRSGATGGPTDDVVGAVHVGKRQRAAAAAEATGLCCHERAAGTRFLDEQAGLVVHQQCVGHDV